MNEKPFDIVIPASAGGFPGIVRELRNGRIITVLSASGQFYVSKDNSPKVDLASGRVSGDVTSPEFSVLMFYNLTGVAVTARVLVSYHPYTGEIPVAATINAAVTVNGKNAPTYTKGTTGTVNAGSALFVGADTFGQLRKSITIFNKETAASGLQLLIYASNGIEAYRVDGRQGVVIESGSTILVNGQNAAEAFADVRYCACEVFYSL